MKRFIIGCLAIAVIVMISCQKEQSFELGNTPSAGSLQSEVTGDCLPKSVDGVYIAAVPLVPATNTLTVSVDVTKTGVYTIYTDTINGYFFRGTGTFVKTGVTAITLRSTGTPFTSGINNFVVNYEGNSCDIAVTVLATAPAGPAVFSGDCATAAVIGGSYATTNPLNFTNTVKLNVNVTTIGTFAITTTKNGMTFAKSGVFTATGPQTVTLEGSGTPTVNGNNDIPVTVGTTTCNFTIPVGNPSVGTLGTAAAVCTPATINGIYTLNTPLVSANNTVQVQVNVATAGVFSISTNTVAGISFAASGTLAVGSTLVTLNGTGTPTASGTQTFTVTYGASTCTFTVTVAGPAVAVYTPNCTGATKNGTYQVGTALTAANTLIIPVNTTTAGTYTISTTLTNGMIFTGSGTLASGAGTITLVGSGTPTAAASPTTNIPIPGAAPCSVAVTVSATAALAVYTPNCAATTKNGTYQVGTALTAANTLVIPVNTTTAGTYNISIPSTNGMVFTGSGTLATGAGTITLTGSGTPTAAAAPTTNIPVPGATPCMVAITVTAAGPVTIDWKFNIGATIYQGQSIVADVEYDVTSAPPVSFLFYAGTNTATDEIDFTLIDIAGGIATTGESYASTSTFTTNACAFYFTDGANTIDLMAQPADPTAMPPTPAVGNMTFVVTSAMQLQKTVTGTFSGTAFDVKSSTNKTITLGTFTAVYL